MACEHMLNEHPLVQNPEKPYTCPQCHYASSVKGFVKLHAVLEHKGMDDADVVTNDVDTG